jgi:hypothetical protein
VRSVSSTFDLTVLSLAMISTSALGMMALALAHALLLHHGLPIEREN